MRTTTLILAFFLLSPALRAETTIFVDDVRFKGFPAKLAGQTANWAPALAEEVRGALEKNPKINPMTMETLKAQLGKEKIKQTLACQSAACVNRIVENFGCSQSVFTAVRYLSPTKVQVTMTRTSGGEKKGAVGPKYTKPDFESLATLVRSMAHELTGDKPIIPPNNKPVRLQPEPKKKTKKDMAYPWFQGGFVLGVHMKAPVPGLMLDFLRMPFLKYFQLQALTGWFYFSRIENFRGPSFGAGLAGVGLRIPIKKNRFELGGFAYPLWYQRNVDANEKDGAWDANEVTSGYFALRGYMRWMEEKWSAEGGFMVPLYWSTWFENEDVDPRTQTYGGNFPWLLYLVVGF